MEKDGGKTQKGSVQVTTDLKEISGDIKKLLEDRVEEVEKKLNKSSELQTFFLTDTFGFLAMEGLLAGAQEVKFQTEEASLSNFGAIQLLSRQRQGVISPGSLGGIVIQICVTIVFKIRGVLVQIKICVTKQI